MYTHTFIILMWGLGAGRKDVKLKFYLGDLAHSSALKKKKKKEE